ncbi:alkaline phosphatase synthesis sensor protein PhoR [Gottschalkia purinilytica]|uniref:histidine kinase n=1 Tax=Gottschalkia purinilytica TaxID=1503 RepID=A0A0L0WEK0_GOTPU|nr:HAMP domain-containing sensor histidine kinase [Gottschalkia purinilytica]KNF09907.1 alkaline phosphatase synthesis sensor protein PhoR [Gottschalkia purinilytica]
MQKRIFLTFVILLIIGVSITGILSFSLFKITVPELESIPNMEIMLIKYQAISILSGLTVSLLLGFRYIKKVTDPIKQLTSITKKISTGNYRQRIHSRTDDELDELSENFNTMSIKLENTIDELQESNTKMKAILTSMLNGVIALDNSKQIILVNPAAEEMFGVQEKEVRGKHILESIRNDDLSKIVRTLVNESKTLESEIEIFNPEYKVLSFHSNLIRLNNDPTRILGMVIILQDVTKIRKLENMRKEFVANVSHELKTPLTSIKGFVETLKEGAAENSAIRDKFLGIIDIEASRLTSLIQDLLTLSEIENENNLVSQEDIDINKSIDRTLKLLNEIANQKNIILENKIQEDIPHIKGNRSWFKQMIINLVDNGIKYTPDGGKVKIEAYNDDVNVYIKVSDTGIGIEEEHLSRLFERFYTVDKARSKQVGGTGLGLAIVKHIVLSFKGNIDVESKIGKGTKFIVSIPIDKSVDIN